VTVAAVGKFLVALDDMTPADINLAVESLPNPSDGHILPGISLQEAIEVNKWHHIHDRHY
jgi:hypothetical protein